MTVMALLEPELGAPAPVRMRPHDHQDSELSNDVPDDDFLAAFFFPELADWRPVLDRLGLPLEVAVHLAAQAEVNATSLQAELLASGAVGEAALFQAIADELDLPFASTVDARKLIVRDEDCLALLRRRVALEHVGGWDPHNVTEDADLGMRLSRFGYRTETLSLPTEEDGPENFNTWLPQRTRWFKGWLQTWLVHTRNPFKLARELDAGSFVIAQILLGGMVVSALAHPILVISALLLSLDLLLDKPLSVWQSAMLVIDAANIACGYLSFILLGWQTLKKPERQGFWKIVLFTPVYWVMMSIAAWRAVWQLWLRPHHWEKTPHQKSTNHRADVVSALNPREIPALRR
ncbi:MAG: hypothetical protein H0T56_03920 [Pseudaminobacter sp.]|nr:hypothetical protein [Pseudaminobacter sp.]